MDQGLYSGVAAMRAGERRLDTIAANLANLRTNGYKRQASFASVLETGRGGARSQQVAMRTATDFSAGPIEQTGNALDLALDGEGFFALQAEDGLRYTRNGSFHVSGAGRLVDEQGTPVAFAGGSGTLQAVGEAITVDPSGQVRQGDNVAGQLLLLDFADRARLTPDGQGHWRAPAELPATPAAATVQQGALERSNVEALDELVALIRAQRGFENAASVMRTIEQSYRRLNNPR